MIQALEPRCPTNVTNPIPLAGSPKLERIGIHQQADFTAELPPTSLRSEGMPIPVQAAHHYTPAESDNEALVQDPESASVATSNGISAIPSPAADRRESAGIQNLERRSRKHSAAISPDCLTPAADKSSWPLLYQMIDVHPSTDEHEFPEVARKSLIRLSLKHGPPVLNEHPEAEERWAVITEAFDALSDPEQKRLYDMQNLQSQA